MDDLPGRLEQHTHQADERGQSFHTPGPFVWIAFFVLVIYPLSVGPVAALSQHSPVIHRTIGAAYIPLGFLYSNCKPAKHFFDWYLHDIWRVRSF